MSAGLRRPPVGDLARPDVDTIVADIASMEHAGFASYWLAQTGLVDALTALVGNWGGLISAASVMLISGAILLRRLRQAGKRRPPSDAPSSKE